MPTTCPAKDRAKTRGPRRFYSSIQPVGFRSRVKVIITRDEVSFRPHYGRKVYTRSLTDVFRNVLKDEEGPFATQNELAAVAEGRFA